MLGNPATSFLLKKLNPSLFLASHMHADHSWKIQW